MDRIQVVPYNVNWKRSFASEAEILTYALGENLAAVHHIGSTSIPGMASKPIIDILLEVRNVNALDLRAGAMESLGYEVMGEFGIPGRRYFRRDDSDGTRTHQIHAFETGDGHIERHLAFRDYMVAHPDAADAYGELKQQLAAKYPTDADGYMDGKEEFIKEIDRKAAEWRAR